VWIVEEGPLLHWFKEAHKVSWQSATY
jgi:hypothetical protein